MTNYSYTWSVPNDGYAFGNYRYETTITGDYSRDNYMDKGRINPYWSIIPPIPSYADDEWKKTHSPYDGRPWCGVTPPPTYYDMEHATTTATSYSYTSTPSDERYKITLTDENGKSTGIISVNPKKLYEDNKKLNEKVKELEKELDYWKTNYRGVAPNKYRDELESLKNLLHQLEEKMKERV